jgi:hypothetical protein
MTARWRVEQLAREVRSAERGLRRLERQLARAGSFLEWNGLVIERNIAESRLKRLRLELAEAAAELACAD